MKTDTPFFLPPFVINEYDPILPQSQTIDWGMSKLNIPVIHDSGITGKGIKVAVIDTYCNPNHPDMIGAVIKSINTTAEPYTAPQNGHGQGCAGIIGARNNTTGVLGVAPDCQIIAIKAMRESGSGVMSEIIAGVDAAIAEKVHIINMSLGTSSDVPEMKAALKRATDAGILVVCSAGNAGQTDSVMYPAKYENTIGVAATNSDGNISAFSSQGWDVDISAPGERILTCWKNNAYATVSGTSFSAPYVSGCLALFLDIKAPISIQGLWETAIDIDAPGKDVKSGYGLISPNGYITRFNTPPNTPPIIPPVDNLIKVKEANKLLNEFLATPK